MSTPSLKENRVDNPGPDRRIGVARVRLTEFRNYVDQELELSEGFNVLSGANAQGKTSFLEALYFLSTTRLLRGQRDSEAVRQSAQRATVTAELLDVSTRIGLEVGMGVRKRATLNSLHLPRASDLIGRMPCVCVSAEDLAIVRGEPSDRRLFLDLELSGLYPAYLNHLTHYKRALEQRNALLRHARDRYFPAEAFEVWETQLAHHGAQLRKVRRDYLRDLGPFAVEMHGFLGHGEEVGIHIVERDEAADEPALLSGLAECRSHDIARGGTSLGPHRDDLLVTVEGREARLYGSQGQQRTAVIAVKMATLEFARRELGGPPLLLLDDILSDLDERRRRLLVELVLQRAGQAVLTCTEAEAAGEAILERARLFEVHRGKIEPR